MSRDPFAVWADMTIKVWPETYWLIDLDKRDLSIALKAIETSENCYSCVIRDQMGFSAIVSTAVWERLGGDARQKFGPLKVVSTDSPLPFDVVGFIQAALREINGAGYKAAPQCGAAADHFFTGEQDIAAVEDLFGKLIEKAKALRP